jgi:hypothetical protein
MAQVDYFVHFAGRNDVMIHRIGIPIQLIFLTGRANANVVGAKDV